MYTHKDANALRYAEMKSQMNNKTLANNLSPQSMSSLSATKSPNLKSKFSVFEESLNDLQTQAQVLVIDTRKTIKKCQFLQTALTQDLLQQYNLRCKQQVDVVEIFLTERKKQTRAKTQQLWRGCESMMHTSEQLKNIVKELQNRIQKIEVTLGFYNAQDKLATF